MGILDLSAVLLCIFTLGQVILAVVFSDEITCHLLCFLSHTGGIGTQVGDETDGAMALYINALVELLGEAHGLLGRKVQRLGRFLLQGTRCKRKRRFLRALPVSDICHDKFLSL